VFDDETTRTIEAFDIAELLEVSVLSSSQTKQDLPPGISN
jgi:hypothetical protein